MMALAAATLVACGETKPGDGNEVTTESLEDITNPNECTSDGNGGASLNSCRAVEIQLSDPVPTGVGVHIVTSEGDVFDSFSEISPPTVGIVGIGDPLTKILILSAQDEYYYAPEWVEVSLNEGDFMFATARFENLDYHCHGDEENPSAPRCWEATPVVLDTSP